MGARTITSYVWPPFTSPSRWCPRRHVRRMPVTLWCHISPASVIADTTCVRGYAMAALLVGMSVMAVMLSVALPVWNTAVRREREVELVFRGEQYVHAIALFQRKYAGTFPPSVEVLVQQRFLRRPYRDPITNDDFQLIYAGSPTPSTRQGGPGRGGPGQPAAPVRAPVTRAGIMGVTSKSTDASLRLYNGRGHYNEWAFVATQATTQAGAPSGAPGTQTPVRGGRRGGPPAGGGLGTPGRRGNPQRPTGQLPPFQLPGRGAPQ